MERAAIANPVPVFRRVPKGVSSYQAAWIVEDGAEEENPDMFDDG